MRVSSETGHHDCNLTIVIVSVEVRNIDRRDLFFSAFLLFGLRQLCVRGFSFDVADGAFLSGLFLCVRRQDRHSGIVGSFGRSRILEVSRSVHFASSTFSHDLIS